MTLRRMISSQRLLIVLLTLTLSLLSFSPYAQAQDQPTAVTLVGSLAKALGCAADNDAACKNAVLTYDSEFDLFVAAFDVPAGDYEYRAALNSSADDPIGANAAAGGDPIKLKVDAAKQVRFIFNAKTGYLMDNVNRIIATIPGDHNAEVGCPERLEVQGDWAPMCLRTLLEDPDGDGIYVFSTKSIPPGSYQAKVAVNESWAENYGADGKRDGSNIGFNVPAPNLNVIFTWDSNSKIMDITIEGAPKGNLLAAKGHWVSRDTIALPGRAFTPDLKYTFHYDPDGALKLEMAGLTGGQTAALTVDTAGLPESVKAKFPHLASALALKLPAELADKAAELLKGQVVVSVSNAEGKIVEATSLQIPGVLDDLYRYDGALGVTYAADVPGLAVWAPTAKNVRVLLFDDSKPTSDATATEQMTLDPATGVWSITGTPDWTGKFYLYEVTVFVQQTGKVELNQVTDPYSVSLGYDSLRSQIVNIRDAALKPDGWDTLAKPELNAPEDIVIYELHIRDFSIFDESVPEALRGKFMAFTQTESNGMKHLIALGKAGVTHIHILPAFDIATVRERPEDRQEPPINRLRGAKPDAELQQQLVERTRSRDGFNWGYDPFHFDVPEGSYATNPDGTPRINEFRAMVKTLNDNGLRVVMDVVYNHTNASGQSQRSVFDRIVPGYYHRLNADGSVEKSTCCENTATEHAMMQKFMVDSVVFWATQYKIDAFRFDLMGHHMKADMLMVRAALDRLTLEKDGVDGKQIYLYGEGWNFGEVADNQRGVNATQLNLPGTGIGTFNDRLRDGVRGGSPFTSPTMQGFATGLFTTPNSTDQGTADAQKAELLKRQDWIKIGLAGNLAGYTLVNAEGKSVTGKEVLYNNAPTGYTLDPQENIVYVSKHDNETLFDKVQMAMPTAAPLADRIRATRLAMSMSLLAQGVPFVQAGDDLLRSKSGDRDSYDSGDWFNALDWTYTDNGWGRGLPIADKNRERWDILRPLLADAALKPTRDDILATVAYFQDMVRVRKSSTLFRLQTAEQVNAHVSFLPTDIPGVIVYLMDDPQGKIDSTHSRIVVVFNATADAQALTDAKFGELALALHPAQGEGSDPVVKTATVDGNTITVPGRTTAVFIARR